MTRNTYEYVYLYLIPIALGIFLAILRRKSFMSSLFVFIAASLLETYFFYGPDPHHHDGFEFLIILLFTWFPLALILLVSRASWFELHPYSLIFVVPAAMLAVAIVMGFLVISGGLK